MAAPAGAAASAPAHPAAKRANIVNTAVKAGQFKTLVSLVKRAGLAKTLSGKGPYTVFAPTDAAFK
ncbi:MAG TPA: fasciclin domain-containing protein, partial [Methylomirabilota bacterium]